MRDAIVDGRRERHRAGARSVLSSVATASPANAACRCPPSCAILPLPIIGAPLFIISNPKLVIAQCKAGVVGAMPALNARPAEQLDEWLAEITETLAALRPRAPRPAGGAVRDQPDRAQEQRPARARHGRCARSTRCRSSSPRSARAPTSTTRCTAGAAIVLHDIINNTFAQEGDREGRRRPDRGRCRRRRPCRREEPVRADRRRSASGSTARSRSRARSPPAARCSPRRRWAPTSPTSARPSSPPRRRAPPTPTSR